MWRRISSSDREETCSHCGGSGPNREHSPLDAPPVMDRVKSARSARPSSVRWYKPQPVLFVMAVARRSQGPAKPVMAAGWNVRRSERKCKFLPVWMRALRSVSPGRGSPGAFGGPNGSLFLVLDVRPHQFFKRRENDIILNLDINIAQAALGADVEIPALDGNDILKIPPGTQPGKVFTMKGKGVPLFDVKIAATSS